MRQGKEFKGRQFTAEVILWAVRWYLMFPISYRDLELMLQDRGVTVDHTTLFRWIQAYAPELEKRIRRLWCAIRVVGAERSSDALSGDALRHRHPEPGHPVQHRAADPGFGLLGRQSPGAQAATDDSFVAGHGGLPKRAPAVADRRLPAQAPLVLDHLDVLVPLTGRGPRSCARHGG